MKERVCLVTGATSGIGKETALALAAKGFTLVLPVRNPEKGEQVKNEIISTAGNSNIEIMSCDLSSLKDVKLFAENFRKAYKQLDILINNAGIWETKRKESQDGIELTFAVNHLAPFLLTNELLDLLLKNPGSRIINVSSEAHRYGKIQFDDIEFTKSYCHIKAYSQSKLANVLFTKELMRKLHGKDVTVNALHPGVVATKLFQNMSIIVRSLSSLFMISPKKGSATSIYLASSFEVANTTGEYFKNRKIVKTSKESNNPIIAAKLWQLSEDYISKFK